MKLLLVAVCGVYGFVIGWTLTDVGQGHYIELIPMFGAIYLINDMWSNLGNYLK